MNASASNLPEWQCKPTVRLEKPITMQLPNNHPGAPMTPCQFHPENPEMLRDYNKLVYDPINPLSEEELVEKEPRWSGDFECGNLGQVFKIGENKYEIHILPDPNEQQTAQWFFFKVEDIKPGEYFFIIAGFFRSCQLHWKGSQICAYSLEAKNRGIGWQKIGNNMNFFQWKTGKFPEWALSFTFTVEEQDTMYFAHSYPYTFTDLLNCMGKLQPMCRPSTLCKSIGDIDVPVIFWDCEEQRCVDIEPLMAQAGDVKNEPPEVRVEEVGEIDQVTIDMIRKWGRKIEGEGLQRSKKPVIIIAARTHPGETNSSYAMEGLIQTLFAKNDFGLKLRKSFSWLLIPMVNPDGAICGFYRPSLSGDDINRVWRKPDPMMHPIVDNLLKLIEVLKRTRPVPFFLDFHGHTAACNSFVYGFMNEQDPNLYSVERVFPLLMTKNTPLFSNEMCSYLKQPAYEGTMRVAIRRRFHIVFAYTLEMSYGGSDFGPRHDTQFTPHDYRAVGIATAQSIAEMFLEDTSLASKEVMTLIPPPETPQTLDATDEKPELEIDGTALESEPKFFSFSAADVRETPPPHTKLVLNQVLRDTETKCD